MNTTCDNKNIECDHLGWLLFIVPLFIILLCSCKAGCKEAYKKRKTSPRKKKGRPRKPSPRRKIMKMPPPKEYNMVYQGTGQEFSNKDCYGSFGASGGCTIVGITTPEGNYVAHVDGTTKPEVFQDISRYSRKKDSEVFLTKNSLSKSTGDKIIRSLPEGKEITFADDTDSLKIDSGKVVFGVPPTSDARIERLDEQMENFLEQGRKSREKFEERGGMHERPPPPPGADLDWYFDTTNWKWVKM